MVLAQLVKALPAATGHQDTLAMAASFFQDSWFEEDCNLVMQTDLEALGDEELAGRVIPFFRLYASFMLLLELQVLGLQFALKLPMHHRLPIEVLATAMQVAAWASGTGRRPSIRH